MAKTKPSQIAQAIYAMTKKADEKEVRKIMESLVDFLAREKMLRQSARIIQALKKLWAERDGSYEVVVESAHPLSDKQLKLIEKQFMKSLDANEVNLLEKKKPELIGGYRVSVLDEVTDLSLSSAVAQLSHSLLTVKK